MVALTVEQQSTIQEIVTPDHARFDVRERRLYSHDTGVLPSMFQPLAGPSLADGVAQPQSEDQVARIARFAASQGIPLVPRGKGTAGYGGAIPAHGGLVLDLTHLKGLIEIDSERLVARVQAGTVWKDLDATLSERGFALCLYPTSAPASTVGGWLAQGGAGIGSHAYGWFRDNVVSARVVGGDGIVRIVEGKDLLAVSDAEGTTGIITEVTLRIRPAVVEDVLAISFTRSPTLAQAIHRISAERIPIWSLSFLNPTMAHLKNIGPPKTHHGHPVHELMARLPEDAYTLLIAFDAESRDLVRDRIGRLVDDLGGKRLSTLVATREWEERFKPMRLKRLGPSIIPAEVVVPLVELAGALDELTDSIHAPLAIEGTSVLGEEIVLLGFIPHDERTVGYNFGYGFALSAIAIAERHGGRAYSTGRYFGHKADSVLGEDRIRQIKARHASVDPANILNPGKVVFGNGAIGAAIHLAGTFEPVVWGAANLFGRPAEPVERKAPAHGFPADVASYAFACAQCGYCVDSCTLYQGRGWESASPRGKWSFLKDVLEGRDKFDQ